MDKVEKGGDVKRTIRHTRSRHEQRIAQIYERAANERIQVEIAEEALEEESERNRNGHGEAQVVLGSQIGAEIREWAKNWISDRDYNFEPATVMGPMDWLSDKTGIHIRRISGMSRDEFQTVSLSQAEAILLAIDRDYLLSNGTIHVIPNPNWSLEKWIEHMRESGCM